MGFAIASKHYESYTNFKAYSSLKGKKCDRSHSPMYNFYLRKYAEGELGEDKSFYFRGPHSKLNLRAQNLILFTQIAEGVDDETWLFHLQRGDYSRWLREAIKDESLADKVAEIENSDGKSASESRDAIKAAIAQYYTLPT